MKRHRGFRLGRCLARVWRRLFRRRHKHYLRLDAAACSLLQSSHLSQTSRTTAKFRHWVLLLASRFRRNSGTEATLLGEEAEGGPTPKGHLAVYVGCERYTVPVIYFNHPLFGELLREAEEEFGFHHTGGIITLPCPAARFEHVRDRIAGDSDRSGHRS